MFYRTTQPEKSGSDAHGAAAIPSIKRRPSVAVLGFRNLSRRPEESWLSPALAEMLNTELAAGERLRLVPSEQIARAKLDLAVPDTETLAKESLAHLHTNLDADYIVLGSYMAIGEKDKIRIRLDLRLQDAKAGETIAEEAVTGAEGDLFELVSEAGSRLRQKLGAGAVSPEQDVRARFHAVERKSGAAICGGSGEVTCL